MSESNGHARSAWALPADTDAVVQGFPLLRTSRVVTVADMLRELGCRGDGREYRGRLAEGGVVGGTGGTRETACAFQLKTCWRGYAPVNHAAMELAWSGRWVPGRRRGA